MGNVLIVDDDDACRNTMGVILSSVGHKVREVGSGSAALEMLANERPDVVITDIVMPEMSGIELIQILSREYPEVSVVAVSGGGGYVEADHYLNVCRVYGVSAAIAKPFLPKNLIDAVNSAIRDGCSELAEG